MQTHYFELRAISQIELTESVVIDNLMQCLHQVLIEFNGEIALSFPGYKARPYYHGLGGVIRLFGSAEQLIALQQALRQQVAVKDYALVTEICAIPTNLNGYLSVRRTRVKGLSALRRAEKRLVQQGKWSDEVRNNMITKWGEVNLSYPHCHLISHSTGQRFILWVNQSDADTPKDGKFNSYGMSQIATVPKF